MLLQFHDKLSMFKNNLLMSGPRREKTRRNYKQNSEEFRHLSIRYSWGYKYERGDLRDGYKYIKLTSESLKEFQVDQNKSLRLREVLTGFLYVRKWSSGRFVEER